MTLLPAQRRLLGLMRVDDAMHIDALIERLGEESSPSEVIAALCELELAGYIRQLPGKNYVRVW
jgi:DNA processing protein